MSTYSKFVYSIHGLIVEVVMSGITLTCMTWEFFFPVKKERHVLSQKDIANIVLRKAK